MRKEPTSVFELGYTLNAEELPRYILFFVAVASNDIQTFTVFCIDAQFHHQEKLVGSISVLAHLL